MGSKDTGDARRRRGQREGIRGQDLALDRTDVGGIRWIAVKNAESGAVVVSERRVRSQTRGPYSREGARRRREGIHDGAPNGGMAETQEVAEFMDKEGFQVIGLGVSAQGTWGREGYERVARIEIDVCVEDLADLGRRQPRPIEFRSRRR